MPEEKSFNPWGISVAIVLAGSVVAVSIYFTRLSDVPSGNQVVEREAHAEVASAVRLQGELKQEAGEFVVGSETAPLTAYLFMDWQCVACEEFYSQVLPEFSREFVDSGQVRLVYKNFPLGEDSERSQLAAEAWQCAVGSDQSREWGERLLGSSADLNIETLGRMAEDAGLDAERMESCLTEHEQLPVIGSGIQAAVATGITEAPAIVIGDWLIEGSIQYEMLADAVSSSLSEESI